MKFELRTLPNYDDATLLDEVRRVARLVDSTRLTMSKFDEFSKVHSATLRRRFGSWGSVLELAGLKESITPQARRIEKDELVELVKKVAAENPSDGLTLGVFTRRTGIGHTVILNRFSSWRALLSEAGLEPVSAGRRYSDLDCFENLLLLWTHYGRQPTYSEVNRPPSEIGTKAYVSRWGGWRNALHAFVEHAEGGAELDGGSPPEGTVSRNLNSEPLEIRSSTRSLSLSIRYAVLKRDGFRCVLCGRSPAMTPGLQLHIDHILAWSRGGTHDLANLRTLCLECNLGKGDKIE